MNLKTIGRIAIGGLLAPVVIGLLAACSSGVTGQAGVADSSAASAARAEEGSADTSAPVSVPTTASALISVTSMSQQQSTAAAPSGSGGAVNHGSNGSAAGAGGIGTQTAPASVPNQPGARFTSFSLTEPGECWSGSAISPELSWKTADATSVGVSIDHPDAVGGFGTFGKAGTLSLPTVACTGSPGTAISHRYDVWALGQDATSHRVVTLTTTVKIKIKPPMVTLTAKPKIPALPPMVTLTAKPKIPALPPMMTLTVKPTPPPPFPNPVIPVNPIPKPKP